MYLKKIISLSFALFSISIFAQDLNIIYTNDLEGTVTPCGCAVDPGGGADRRLNWYKQNNFSPLDTIYINAGSTLFSGASYMDYEAEALKIGAGILVDSMLAMNIDAYTPGAYDLKMGLDFFKTTTKKLPVLISNSDNKKFLKEIKIQRSGRNIRIFGITTLAKGFSTYEPVKALRKLTAKKAKKDLFILLADTDQKTLNSILKSINNIDVVLSSSIDEQLTQPKHAGKTAVLRLLKGGDSIGLLKKENQIIFLGDKYIKDNELTDRIKKYEGLQQATAPKIKDDF